MPSQPGSSPLARGLPLVWSGSPPSCGIIPARAGFTRRRRSSCPTSADHPRSRGVYRGGVARALRSVGSSPLARGLPTSTATSEQPPRIIPARAGFTAPGPGRSLQGADHPRSRGVYRDADGTWHTARGSSPLARGLPGRSRRGLPPAGIIPARAGFTKTSIPSQCAATDHPRSRGVYGLKRIVSAFLFGSSPLARGLRKPLSQASARRRIIPARAGFTA